MTERFFSLGEVARSLKVQAYRITYAIAVGHLPDASQRIAGKRLFSTDDVRRMAVYFEAQRTTTNTLDHNTKETQ